VPAIAVSPSNPSVAYVGGAIGGVWATTDGGAHWVPRFSAAQNAPIGSLAVDPVNTNIVWAGTGEGNLNALTHAGDGVYRSTDSGVTWAPVGGSLFDNCGIPAIVVDPTAHNTVLAAVRQPYGKSMPLLPGPCSAHGIYRSTDSGTSWQLVRAGEPTDLAVDPTTPTRWYAAFQVYSATAGTDALARSLDGGVTWSVPGAGLPAGLSSYRMKIAVSPVASGRLYAAAIAFTGTTSTYVVETSGDAGVTWAQLPVPGGDSGWDYRLAITADPTEVNTFYLGGLYLYTYQAATTASPTETLSLGNADVHVDQQTMVFDTSHRLWLGNDGGAYRSSDGAQTFVNLNATLSLAQFYTSLSGTTGVVLTGGTQDIGAAAYDGATQWRALFPFSDIIHTAVDPTDPGTIYALSHGRNVFKTTDGGQTWNLKSINVAEPFCDFTNPLVLDPGDHQRLYSGGTSHVLRSDDGGNTWSSLPTGFNECVAAVAPAINNPLVVVAGTDFGVHRTTDGGQTWSSIQLFNVHSLTVDPHNPNHIYAAHEPCGSCGALSAGNLAVSNDAGNTWTNITGNLPSVDASNIAVDDGTTPPTLYAATDAGVYGSTDSGTTWTLVGSGLPRVEATDVMVDHATNQLVATTFGRGVYTLALRPPSVTVVAPNGGEQPQSGRTTSITWNAAPGTPVRIDLLHNDVLVGPIATSVTTSAAGTGSYRWTIGPQLGLGGGYRVWVRALNGPAGDATDRTFSIAPAAPTAPRAPNAVPGRGQATVNWIAPTDAGTSAITGYVVTPYLAGAATTPRVFNSAANTEVISGLTNTKSYTFKVAAKNAVGTGPQSIATAAILVGLPTAPTNVVAVASPGRATVHWTAPSSNGGSPITGYGVTVPPGGRIVSVSGTHATISGLAPGTYTFRVRAKNAVGSGPWSLASNAVSIVTAQGGSSGSGYWMLGADGTVYAFGNAARLGSALGPAVAMVARRDGSGYWVTDAAGDVSHFGTAANHGGRPTLGAGERVSTISATPSGGGFWLFTNRGRAFAYGDAHLYGDMSATVLNGPVVASVATPTGHGYYMVASDGGVFSFGDAHFRGSTGAMRLNRPIVGISPTPDNHGYWLVASDGGVFAFTAPFRGSMGATPLNRPVNGLVAYGNGYLMVASDGGVFDFSNKAFVGSLANSPPSAPIIGIAAA
jgi:photosystem II stability/assembly factor-like uncharacterized protein